MKKNTYLLLLILFLLLVVILNPRFFTKEREGAGAGPAAPGIYSIEDGIPADTLDQFLRKTGFSIAYSNEYRQAGWVAYILTGEEARSVVADRTDDFRIDTLLTGNRASLEDYSRSGYDRGHLAPAGDMKWSLPAMSESFLLSNMSPQVPGFNRGIWNTIESRTRDWAVAYDSLFVITGPVLTEMIDTIGNIPVPKYFFKIIFDISPPGYKAIAFLMENRTGLGDFRNYATSIDSIESITGFDFFPSLPAGFEVLEREAEPEKWK